MVVGIIYFVLLYLADFMAIRKSGHNLMMEKSCLETARSIDNWLSEKQVS